MEDDRAEILVVSQDRLAGDILAGAFEASGFGPVGRCAVIEEAGNFIHENDPALVFFLGGPVLPAFQARVRETGKSPAVLVLADQGGAGTLEDLSERDVFSSPVRLGTLLDRAAVLIRQHKESAGLPKIIALGPYDFLHHENTLVRRAGGGILRLTDKERGILLALFKAAPVSMDRESLLQAVWGYVKGVETHTLETHVYRLRQKIEADPANPQIVLTRGNGYILGV